MRSQLQEIDKDLQASSLALFRVKLNPIDIVPLDNSGKRNAIIDGCCYIVGNCRRAVVTVDEVGEILSIDPIQYMAGDRKSTRLNSSHVKISYAVFCLKKK